MPKSFNIFNFILFSHKYIYYENMMSALNRDYTGTLTLPKHFIFALFLST